MTASAFRRVIRLQRQILYSLRADVRKVIGPQTRELKRYYEAYKREFHGKAKSSSKEGLLEACEKSSVILMGDYHTFAQSQKAALRLLSDIAAGKQGVALGLELVRATDQPVLNSYIRGEITEEQFLARIDYDKSWGFDWKNFKPLFEFAVEHGIEVVALNLASDDLAARDAAAGEIIASWAERNPQGRIFALYGDLHLARTHIPRYLRIELEKRGIKRRILSVFQNSEALYWRLAEDQSSHAADVLQLGRDRFCIMSASPWVKLQSYLDWAEAGATLASEDGPTTDLHAAAHDRMHKLAEVLELPPPVDLDFTVKTVDELSTLLGRKAPAMSGLKRSEAKAIKYQMLGNRTALIPGPNILYLPSMSVNALAEGSALLVHAASSEMSFIAHDPREHFFVAILNATLAYFGSKIINHKRKCDMEEDFHAFLNRPLDRAILPREKLQRRVARLVLAHSRAQHRYAGGQGYRAPLTPSGPASMPLFLETTRALGRILGEKLYASFTAGRYPAKKITMLFQACPSTSRESRALYLDLVKALDNAPVVHSRKTDLF